VDECKPLPASTRNIMTYMVGTPMKQGLTLVHLSAQLETLLTLETTPKRLNTPPTPP